MGLDRVGKSDIHSYIKRNTAFYESYTENFEAKLKVAEFIVRSYLLKDSTVFLDNGSSAYAIAVSLSKLSDRHFKIVTPNIAAATYLLQISNCEIFFLGGIIDKSHLCSIGPPDYALEKIPEAFMEIDLALITAAGLTVEENSIWIWSRNPYQFDQKLFFCQNSNKTIVVTDSEKLGWKHEEMVYGLEVKSDIVSSVIFDETKKNQERLEKVRNTLGDKLVGV